MMRKFLIVLLSLILLVSFSLAVVGCKPQEEKKPAPAPEKAPAAAPEKAPEKPGAPGTPEKPGAAPAPAEKPMEKK